MVQIFHVAKATRVTSRPQSWCEPQGNECGLKGRLQRETKSFEKYTRKSQGLYHELKKKKKERNQNSFNFK